MAPKSSTWAGQSASPAAPLCRTNPRPDWGFFHKVRFLTPPNTCPAPLGRAETRSESQARSLPTMGLLPPPPGFPQPPSARGAVPSPALFPHHRPHESRPPPFSTSPTPLFFLSPGPSKAPAASPTATTPKKGSAMEEPRRPQPPRPARATILGLSPPPAPVAERAPHTESIGTVVRRDWMPVFFPFALCWRRLLRVAESTPVRPRPA